MLATAICLERYMKKELSASVRDTIERDWLARWKECLGNPESTPRQVLRAYVEELDITAAQLDDDMDWDCWADDDNDVPDIPISSCPPAESHPATTVVDPSLQGYNGSPSQLPSTVPPDGCTYDDHNHDGIDVPAVDNLPPPGSLFDEFYRPASSMTVTLDLHSLSVTTPAALSAPNIPLPFSCVVNDSVTHVVCTPRVCGLRGNTRSTVTVQTSTTDVHGKMVDGGSNICVTGDHRHGTHPYLGCNRRHPGIT